MTIYVIEHLESELYEWCIAEYKHASKVVGKENMLITNIKKDANKLKDFAKVEEKSVSEIGLKNCCVLDPNAKKTLTPKDKFDYYIFGGILGDDPPKSRTKEISLDCEKRNLGRKQMSTDTAVIATKMVNDGTPLEKIKFVDDPEIDFENSLSLILPYRYLEKNGKPVLPKEVIKHLAREDVF